jgi:phenylalanyl-tRNA synthetase alpha chain
LEIENSRALFAFKMSLQERILEAESRVHAAVIGTAADLEAFRLEFLSRKGLLSELFDEFKSVSGPEKAVLGKSLNALKKNAEEKFKAAQEVLTTSRMAAPVPDLTLPGEAFTLGSRHPVAIVERKVVEVFSRIGFRVEEGPEIETDEYNFTALNFEPDHPAREMQDTFFLDAGKEYLLRTHTSPVQVRVMKTQKPPIRMIAPGRVYRNETITARSHCYFQQVEGLVIDENASFADLRQTLNYFASAMFGPKVKVRLRPSYFPFTEISAEADVSCLLCEGTGCPVCKHTGWVEIVGCGMVDPAVLENCGLDPDRYQGYAFGFGIERMALVLYRIPDIRLYSQNDVRFLSRFQSL